MQDRSLFQVLKVKKYYGERLALDIDEMLLEKDRTYAILGPNGAGKSTLLRLLNLLDRPDSGSIYFMGQPTDQGESIRLEMARRMCMVFQQPYIFRTTVYNNVAYGLNIRRIKSREKRKRIERALAITGLQGYANRPAQKLSGGEMQRVALARALALEPEVLLLDEPTANLDPSSVQVIENIIRHIRAEKRTTVIIVTHNLFQARRIADETILLVNGRLTEMKPTEILFANPQDDRTRAFLDGSMVY